MFAHGNQFVYTSFSFICVVKLRKSEEFRLCDKKNVFLSLEENWFFPAQFPNLNWKNTGNRRNFLFYLNVRILLLNLHENVIQF